MSMSRIIAPALLAAVALAFTGCDNREMNYKNVEIDELKAQVRDLDAQLAACEMRKTHDVLSEMGPAAETLTGQTKSIGGGVTMGTRDQETYISVPGSILFKPGSARLNTAAKATLAHIIEVINEKYPGRHVRVDGFTDNEPVTRSKDKWDDNFDLAGGRALSVLHYLEAHGIAKGELGFAGFGENRAKATNVSESGRAKNRRVEIVVSNNSDVSDEPTDSEIDATAPESKPVHHHKKKAKPAGESTAPSTDAAVTPAN